jgi:hypothetical protein
MFGMLLSQWLTVIGLVLEFVSVAVTIRKLFYGYYKRLERVTTREGIKRDRIEGTVVLILLVIGMTLQALAIFV